MKEKIHEIIFEAETPAGRLFDVLLLWVIAISVGAVLLESVEQIRVTYATSFLWAERFFTLLFTLEYLLRVFSVKKPLKYIFSFYGIIDLLAIIPSYLSFYYTGVHSLLVIRSIRMLRVFRIFKLGRYLGEANVLGQALKASRAKISVFLIVVLSFILIMGTVMYLIEGEANGFNSIPSGLYWAVVTMTTVGYGDIVPQTILGRFLASVVMIMGYAIIAVPTGIVSAELANVSKAKVNTISCPSCTKEGHDLDAIHCRFCGSKL